MGKARDRCKGRVSERLLQDLAVVWEKHGARRYRAADLVWIASCAAAGLAARSRAGQGIKRRNLRRQYRDRRSANERGVISNVPVMAIIMNGQPSPREILGKLVLGLRRLDIQDYP